MIASDHPYAEHDRQFWLAADNVRVLVENDIEPFSFQRFEEKLMPEADFSIKSLHSALLHMLANGELKRTDGMAIQAGNLQPVGS